MFKDKENSIDIYATDIIYHESKRLDSILDSLTNPAYFLGFSNNDLGLTSLSYIKLNTYNAKQENYFTESSGAITCNRSGKYEITISFGGTYDASATTAYVIMALYKNDSLVNNVSSRIDFDDIGKQRSGTVKWVMDLKNNDELDLRFRGTESETLTFNNLYFLIKQIGG